MSRPRSNSPIESRKAFITEVKVRRAYLDMSQNDLGHILGISPARVSGLLSNPDELTVGRLRRAGKIAYIQHVKGGKVWFSEDAVREYIARTTHAAQPQREVKGTYRKRRR